MAEEEERLLLLLPLLKDSTNAKLSTRRSSGGFLQDASWVTLYVCNIDQD